MDSRKYIWMNGKEVDCFIGRVTADVKMIVKEVSLTPKENKYGKYLPVTLRISKTRFNGKELHVFIRSTPMDVLVYGEGYTCDFKVELKYIDLMIENLKGDLK